MVKRFLATVLGTAVVLVVTLLIRQALHATYPVSTSAALPAAPTWAVTPTVDPVRVAREAQEAATRDVAEVSLDTLLDAPPDWQDATSIWHNGALPSASGTWEPLYVLAKPGLKDHARVWGVSRNGGVAPEYVPQWVAPLPVGTLTITNATGPWGVISFTASGGQTGTLDLATGVWTIDGAVLPSLVPTPTPTGQP